MISKQSSFCEVAGECAECRNIQGIKKASKLCCSGDCGWEACSEASDLDELLALYPPVARSLRFVEKAMQKNPTENSLPPPVRFFRGKAKDKPTKISVF